MAGLTVVPAQAAEEVDLTRQEGVPRRRLSACQIDDVVSGRCPIVEMERYGLFHRTCIGNAAGCAYNFEVKRGVAEVFLFFFRGF